MPTFLVRGCGVSLVCQRGDSMLWWISYIIERGGVPDVTWLTEQGVAS